MSEPKHQLVTYGRALVTDSRILLSQSPLFVRNAHLSDVHTQKPKRKRKQRADKAGLCIRPFSLQGSLTWVEMRRQKSAAESADAERRVYVGGPESAVNTMYNVHSDSDRIPRCWTASLTTASVARSLSAHIDATLCYCPFSLCHGSLADGGKSPMLKLLAVERINTVVGYGIWVIVAVESTRSFI